MKGILQVAWARGGKIGSPNRKPVAKPMQCSTKTSKQWPGKNGSHFGSRTVSDQVNIVAASSNVFHRIPFGLLIRASVYNRAFPVFRRSHPFPCFQTIARVKMQRTFLCFVRRRRYLQFLFLLMVLFPISTEWVFAPQVRLKRDSKAILARKLSQIDASLGAGIYALVQAVLQLASPHWKLVQPQCPHAGSKDQR